MRCWRGSGLIGMSSCGGKECMVDLRLGFSNPKRILLKSCKTTQKLTLQGYSKKTR